MKKWIISACLLMMQAGAWAKVTLPDIMSDNMVLQQQTEACLWGKANANAEVTIRPSWNRETYKVTAGADGKWTDQNIEIDLDDGVKHNYELFADVLAKIK